MATIRKGSLRWRVLLWICTDPAGSWTQRDILCELGDMGTARQSAVDAVGGLVARGLVERVRVAGGRLLLPTAAGSQAIRCRR